MRRGEAGQPVRLLHRLGPLPLVIEALQPEQGRPHFLPNRPDQPLGRGIELAPAARHRDQAVEVAIADRRLDQRAHAKAGAG